MLQCLPPLLLGQLTGLILRGTEAAGGGAAGVLGQLLLVSATGVFALPSPPVPIQSEPFNHVGPTSLLHSELPAWGPHWPLPPPLPHSPLHSYFPCSLSPPFPSWLPSPFPPLLWGTFHSDLAPSARTRGRTRVGCRPGLGEGQAWISACIGMSLLPHPDPSSPAPPPGLITISPPIPRGQTHVAEGGVNTVLVAKALPLPRRAGDEEWRGRGKRAGAGG